MGEWSLAAKGWMLTKIVVVVDVASCLVEEILLGMDGVRTRMIKWLMDHASRHAVGRVRLMVSKDNVAANLYRQQGFGEHVDRGDAIIMVREIGP